MWLKELFNEVLSELVRLVLRLLHKLVPKIIKFFNYRGIKLYIPEGIFNPTFTLSASLIMDNIKPRGVVVDLGCGSGILSIYSALIPEVTAVLAYDINIKALATTKVNSRINGVANKVRVLHNTNDLMNVKADYVLINPPYLPISPRDTLDLNWCCGKSLECIEELLNLSLSIIHKHGKILFTFSSLTNTKVMAKIISKLNIKFNVIAFKRTVIDTIYLALIESVRSV